MIEYPRWTPFQLPDYASVMRGRCDALLEEIVADGVRRRVVLTDPRAIHAELFAGLTPDGFSDYAGTYRGTPGTSLADRRIFGPSLLTRGETFEFVPPQHVERQMNDLMGFVDHVCAETLHDNEAKLGCLAKAFGYFGCIHPFLDGNGHVQRALFAAMATEFGIPLSFRFVLHPRPYDILLGTMLELFTKNRGCDDDIARVAEYLRFFLAGDFARPLNDF